MTESAIWDLIMLFIVLLMVCSTDKGCIEVILSVTLVFCYKAEQTSGSYISVTRWKITAYRGHDFQLWKTLIALGWVFLFRCFGCSGVFFG